MPARKYLPVDLDRRIREAAGNRCGYCQSHQDYVLGPLQIEHIYPVSEGGTDEEGNLWLACSLCNGHKSNQTQAVDVETGETVPLFNPRIQPWSEHFRWSDDGIHIIGLTPIGRATVIALHLRDDPIALTVRANWVSAGWHPPREGS